MTNNEVRMTNQTIAARHKLALAPLLLLTLLASTGCGRQIWQLPGAPQTRRDVYMNLMTPDERTHFWSLESEEAPASLKMAYLQEIGVYQKWAEQPKEVQAAILRRQVVESMSSLQVQLAWGPPDNERNETEPAERLAGHTKIVWEYKPRILKTGDVGYERSVCLLDDRVLWVRRNP
jgi:hypothetical protein